MLLDPGYVPDSKEYPDTIPNKRFFDPGGWDRCWSVLI